MEPHPVKTAIEGWRGTERKLWCHLWRYKWKAHTRSATLWRNVATFWSNKKWMVTLAQQNQRHEFSCPPNLSSSTRAAMARRWSLKCDQHERVSLSGILSTFVYNAVVTPTGFRGATEFSWPTKSVWSTMYLHTWQQMCWTRYQKRLYGWLMPCTCIFLSKGELC